MSGPRPSYSWRSLARALEQLVEAGLVTKGPTNGVYTIAVAADAAGVAEVDGGVDALVAACRAEGLLEVGADGEIAMSDRARARARAAATWPTPPAPPSLAAHCSHERVRFLRAVANAGACALVFGNDVIPADVTGTALAHWCEDCGAVGRPSDGEHVWSSPTHAVARALASGGTPARACPNCGARAEIEDTSVPLLACLACGWQRNRVDGAIVVDAEALEQVAVRELDAACNNVARAATLLEEVRPGGELELVDRRAADARDPVALVYAEEWNDLQEALKTWHAATQAFLALLPRKPRQSVS